MSVGGRSLPFHVTLSGSRSLLSIGEIATSLSVRCTAGFAPLAHDRDFLADARTARIDV